MKLTEQKGMMVDNSESEADATILAFASRRTRLRDKLPPDVQAELDECFARHPSNRGKAIHEQNR